MVTKYSGSGQVLGLEKFNSRKKIAVRALYPSPRIMHQFLTQSQISPRGVYSYKKNVMLSAHKTRKISMYDVQKAHPPWTDRKKSLKIENSMNL